MIDRHLRLQDVLNATGLKRSTIYAMMESGEFPRPVKLTEKAVAWPESKVAEWLKSRAQT